MGFTSHCEVQITFLRKIIYFTACYELWAMLQYSFSDQLEVTNLNHLPVLNYAKFYFTGHRKLKQHGVLLTIIQAWEHNVEILYDLGVLSSFSLLFKAGLKVLQCTDRVVGFTTDIT